MNLDDLDDLEIVRPSAATIITPRERIEPAKSTRRPVRKGEDEAEKLSAPVTLLGLDVVGFKRIRAVKFRVSRDGITVIGGGNAQGKSSCLEAITCLLGGGKHIPEVPVNLGEKRAEIAADLEDAQGRKYHLKRVINTDRQGYLEITRADGTQVGRAQEFLQAMQGVLWFDPCAFLSKPAKEQAEDLRRLVGLDFSELNQQRQKIYDQRTMIGRDRDRAKGHFEKLPFHADAPESEASAADLQAELAKANAHNQAYTENQMKLQKGENNLVLLQREVESSRNACQEMRDRIARLQAQLEQAEVGCSEAEERAKDYTAKIDRFRASLADFEEIPTAEIVARMSDVEAANTKIRENQARAQAHTEWQDHEAQYEAQTFEIGGIDAEKRRQIAEAKFPVPGLAFDDEGVNVLFDNLPLSQASGAEQMRVAVAVAMGMSGGLRVCLVDEGERLDMGQLAALDQTVQELGGQVIMARVSTGDECSIIVEDGAVREALAA